MEINHPLRVHVEAALSRFPIPPEFSESTPREGGGFDYAKRWVVRDQLVASVCDADNVMELGLLERIEGGDAINVLHLTLVLEEGRPSELNSMSEFNSDFNFDCLISEESTEQLDKALNYFGDLLKG